MNAVTCNAHPDDDRRRFSNEGDPLCGYITRSSTEDFDGFDVRISFIVPVLLLPYVPPITTTYDMN